MPFGSAQGLPAGGRKLIAKRICIYIMVWFVAFLFEPTFFIQNLQVLLPTCFTVGIFLYFCLRLRLRVQDNVFGEIGFIYLAFAVAYTVFPAYGFLTLDVSFVREWISGTSNACSGSGPARAAALASGSIYSRYRAWISALSWQACTEI